MSRFSRRERFCFWSYFATRAIFLWPWKPVSVSVLYLFYQPMDEKIKTWTLRFPVKENPYKERSHGSIGQSRCSMTSKRSIDWFLETSPARSFFSRAFALSTKTNTCLYSFDKSIKWHDFRSFFWFCFVRAFSFQGHTKIALSLFNLFHYHMRKK